MKTKTVPKAVQDLVKHYLNLEINGKTVSTPYYRNIKRIRAGLRVLVGKGSPEEIEEETLIYAKLRKKDLNNLKPEEIRKFMINQGIGIDCSGFVAHLIDTWLKKEGRGGLGKNIKYPTKSIYRRILTHLRAIESTGADILTNKTNSKKVSLTNILPGDLIRLKGIPKGDHLVMIHTVKYEDNLPKMIKYVHSTDRFGKESGVKFGKIKITDPNGELKDQNWFEKDADGKKQTYKQLLHKYEDNGLRRLNCLKDLQND